MYNYLHDRASHARRYRLPANFQQTTEREARVDAGIRSRRFDTSKVAMASIVLDRFRIALNFRTRAATGRGIAIPNRSSRSRRRVVNFASANRSSRVSPVRRTGRSLAHRAYEAGGVSRDPGHGISTPTSLDPGGSRASSRFHLASRFVLPPRHEESATNERSSRQVFTSLA